MMFDEVCAHLGAEVTHHTSGIIETITDHFI